MVRQMLIVALPFAFCLVGGGFSSQQSRVKPVLKLQRGRLCDQHTRISYTNSLRLTDHQWCCCLQHGRRSTIYTAHTFKSTGRPPSVRLRKFRQMALRAAFTHAESSFENSDGSFLEANDRRAWLLYILVVKNRHGFASRYRYNTSLFAVAKLQKPVRFGPFGQC